MEIAKQLSAPKTLTAHLVDEFKQLNHSTLTPAQTEVLDSLVRSADQLLARNPVVGHRYESNMVVFRLQDGTEVSLSGEPGQKAGDGSMAPEPNGPGHIQI